MVYYIFRFVCFFFVISDAINLKTQCHCWAGGIRSRETAFSIVCILVWLLLLPLLLRVIIIILNEWMSDICACGTLLGDKWSDFLLVKAIKFRLIWMLLHTFRGLLVMLLLFAVCSVCMLCRFSPHTHTPNALFASNAFPTLIKYLFTQSYTIAADRQTWASTMAYSHLQNIKKKIKHIVFTSKPCAFVRLCCTHTSLSDNLRLSLGRRACGRITSKIYRHRPIKYIYENDVNENEKRKRRSSSL